MGWVTEHYIDKKLSMPQISELLGCSVNAVSKSLKRYNIKPRGHSDGVRLALKSRGTKRDGPNNPKWGGGKMVVGGYIYVHAPEHPHATQAGYMCEHRLVMEKRIGRFLTKKEVVHHRDRNKKNNNASNLELISSSGKHFIEHHLQIRDKKGRFLLVN